MYKIFIVLDKNNIFYIKYIFEGYDGVAQVTTIDRQKAVVSITYDETWQYLVDSILDALQKEGVIKEVLES